MSKTAADGRTRAGGWRSAFALPADGSPTYSLVVPARDEEAVILELASRLASVMDQLDDSAEAILVDDGSRDHTYELMLQVARSDSRFKLVRLSRNFGHQIALTA